MFSASNCTTRYRSRSFSHINSSVNALPFLSISTSSSLLLKRFNISAGSWFISSLPSIQILNGNIHSYFAVGSGKRLEDGTLIKLDVKAGDRILFGKYAGTEIKVDGVEHIIIREDEVLGVIE